MILFHIAIAAMDLNCFGGDIHGRFGGIILGHCTRCAIRFSLVFQPGCLQAEITGCFNTGVHFCKFKRHVLVVDELSTKGFPVFGILESPVKCSLCNTQCL